MSVIYIGVGGHVVAIREATGEELWRTKVRRASFVTICARPTAIYAGAAGHLFCLDPASGAIRWHNSLDGLGTGLVAFGDTTVSAAADAAAQAATATAVAASSAR
jgi:outer membrane protein assembly factor BamB